LNNNLARNAHHADRYNVVDDCVDRHLRERRGEKAAIFCGSRTLTYSQIAEILKISARTATSPRQPSAIHSIRSVSYIPSMNREIFNPFSAAREVEFEEKIAKLKVAGR
jgi:hypothetical protein